MRSDQEFHVLACTVLQARRFAEQCGVEVERLVYVNDTDSIRGINGFGATLHMVGDYMQMRDAREIVDMAIVRGFNLVDVRRNWGVE